MTPRRMLMKVHPRHNITINDDRRNVRGHRVTVVGAARSGMAAATLLQAQKAMVFVTDHAAIDDSRRAILTGAGIEFEEGGHTDRALDADYVVTSPGIPDSACVLIEAVEKRLPIYSEIEVAAWFCDAPIIAVTGSNGKTTTTSLIGHIFRTDGKTTHVAGNIGNPFSAVVAKIDRTDVVVLEVSSFQLDHIDSFRPRVSVLLNITPDHLDRYGDALGKYAESKFRIRENQQSDDVFIYNLDDEQITSRLQAMNRSSRPTSYGYTVSDTPSAAGFIQDEALIIQTGAKKEVLMQSDELALRGRHNTGNSLAAAIAARVMEVRSEIVRSSLSSFEGVPHRLEFVREVNGIRYVNDSKATNINAVWFALKSMYQPVVLIAGGRDKGNDYESLRELVTDRVRILLAIGESAEKVADELGSYVEQTVMADSMAEAVSYASLLARNGETVLLSPACSSFDMFDNFEERGDVFKRLVSDL